MIKRDGWNTLPMGFMGTCASYEDANIVLVGVPMDFTCSFRPGARFGPGKIREVSYGIEEFSFYSEKSLDDKKYFDAGDIDLPIGSVEKSLEIIESAASDVLNDGKIPLFIGGEHLISMPVIKCVHRKYGDDLAIFHFDAHADLRDDYIGRKQSHATTIRRVADFVKPKNIYQFGIRSGSAEEMQYARANTNFFPFDVYEPLHKVLPSLKDRPIYVTLDIDVIDPAFANGTGTPEPGGIGTREMLNSLLLLRDYNVVGFDIVEISPPLDHSDRTAVLGAKLIREMIFILDKG